MTTTNATTSTVNTTGSTSYLTGTASGLDTASLIAASVAQKTAPADVLDAKVTADKTKIAAYQNLQSLVTALSTSMNQLAASTFSSVATTANAFANKSVSMTSSDGTPANNYLAVSADSDAAAASYNVTVSQLATAQKVASSAQSSTTALGLTGTFTLGEASGTAQAISVTPSMTLGDLQKAINGVSAASGVSASLIQVGAGSYKLVLSANDTNQAITASATTGDDILNSVGLTDAGGAFATTLQAAKPAIVVIDGNTVTGDSNNLTDVVSGLSMSLLNTTPAGTTVTLAVQPDVSGVKTAITDFITAYNSLRSFVSDNQAVGSDGSVSSTAVLFADSLLRGASQSLNSLISGDNASATGGVKNLADLGITLDSGNNLTLSSETTLDNALLGNLSGVSSLFQTSFTPSDSALKLLKNATGNSFDFTLDVTTDGAGTITGASVGGDSSQFTVSGGLIVGAKGSIYEGLSFALATTNSTSISVKIDQGLANQLTNFSSQYGSASGLIQQQIDSLTSQDQAYSTRSDQIRSDAADFKQKLVEKYAQMETEVSAAKLMQQQIAAIITGAANNG